MKIRQELLQYYRWLRRYGLNDSHSGNASVREGDTIWVTPTGACADTLEPQALVKCSIHGERGDNASLDAALHIQVYQQNPLARAVLHSHGPHTVALTFDGKSFTPPDFEGGFYFPYIPVLDIPYAEYIQKAPALVAQTLADYPVTVVRGHGVYAWGENLNFAYKWTCSLELSAKTAFIARNAGTLI